MNIQYKILGDSVSESKFDEKFKNLTGMTEEHFCDSAKDDGGFGYSFAYSNLGYTLLIDMFSKELVKNT